ncbi:MAG: hypothetical protein M3Y08_19020 [Fibrobacterota bacterium]|nr:hypothetical protein [Fibrobacterota bacterium]
MKFLLSIMFMVFGCDNSINSKNNLIENGRWEEILNPSVEYFSGSRLKFDIQSDSVFIEEMAWTDVISCSPNSLTCTKGSWQNYYAGQRSQSEKTIKFNYKFINTTRDALPVNPMVDSVEFGVMNIKDSLILIKKSLGDFIGKKDTIKIITST